MRLTAISLLCVTLFEHKKAIVGERIGTVPLSEHDEMMAMSIEFVRRSVLNKLYDKETSRADSVRSGRT